MSMSVSMRNVLDGRMDLLPKGGIQEAVIQPNAGSKCWGKRAYYCQER